MLAVEMTNNFIEKQKIDDRERKKSFEQPMLKVRKIDILELEDVDKKKFNSDWNLDELKFPQIRVQLKRQVEQHKTLHERILIRKRQERIKEENEKLDRIDVEINLKRLLNSNEKYIGLCRDLKRPESIFGKVLMQKLKRDTVMGKYDDPTKRPMYNFEEEARMCHRFSSNSQRFEDSYWQKVFDSKLERRSMSLRGAKNSTNDVREHVSHSIGEFEFMKQMPSSDKSIIATDDTDLKSQSTIIKHSQSFSQLKPRKQIVQASFRTRILKPIEDSVIKPPEIELNKNKRLPDIKRNEEHEPDDDNEVDQED